MIAASTVPVWVAVAVGAASAIAAALSSISSLIMSIVNWRKLEAMHQTLRAQAPRPRLERIK